VARGAPIFRWPRYLLGAWLAALSACAPHVFVPPVGPGEPFPDAAQAWSEATRACRGASTYAATLHVRGKVARESLSATIMSLVTRTDQIALSAPVMFGPPAFVLGGAADQATLWLPRQERVISARADEIVEALTGLRLGPSALLAVLSGCVGQAGTMTASARYGPLGAVTTDDGRMYLEQRDGRWRIVRGLTGGLIVEYSDIRGDWPRALRITTEAGRSPAVSLSMTIDQFDVNLPHEAREFAVNVAPGATPMTLEELRAAGPLREKK
jgi:hypothetical protein